MKIQMNRRGLGSHCYAYALHVITIIQKPKQQRKLQRDQQREPMRMTLLF